MRTISWLLTSDRNGIFFLLRTTKPKERIDLKLGSRSRQPEFGEPVGSQSPFYEQSTSAMSATLFLAPNVTVPYGEQWLADGLHVGSQTDLAGAAILIAQGKTAVWS